MTLGTSRLSDKLARLKIVPVIVIEDPSAAAPLASALTDGGLPCAEITFRTAGAADALRRMSDAARRLARPDAARAIVDKVVALAR